MASSTSVAAFEAWMEGMGICWDAVRIVDGGSSHGWGVKAVKDVSKGHVLCHIPKPSILSVVTTGLADVLEAERVRGGLALVMAVMYERALGDKSPWCGYLDSLPPRVYLPVFWTDEELKLLKGTELEGKVQGDRLNVQSDWDEHVAPLAAKYPDRIPKSGWDFTSFSAAASWVSSRAFRVDDNLGDALVPFADVFNHKASIVVIGDDFEVVDGSEEDEEEEEEVKPLNARVQKHNEQMTNGRNQEDMARQTRAQKAQEPPVFEPAAKKAKQHSSCTAPTQPCDCSQALPLQAPATMAAGGDQAGCKADRACCKERALSAATEDPAASAVGAVPVVGTEAYTHHGIDLRMQIAIMDAATQDGVEMLEVVAARDLPSGCEVFNTYGEHGDAELVHRYGFALHRLNPFTEVQLDPGEVVAAAQRLHSLHLSSGSEGGTSQFVAATPPAKGRGKRGAKKACTAPLSAGQVEERVEREMSRRVEWVQASSSLLPGSRLRPGEGTEDGEDSNDDSESSGHEDSGSSGQGEVEGGSSEEGEEGGPDTGSGGEEGDEGGHKQEAEEAEECDPLCVLPTRTVNTSMWLLLTALCAPHTAVSRWLKAGAGVDAILQEAQEQRDPTAGAAMAAQPAKRKRQDEDTATAGAAVTVTCEEGDAQVESTWGALAVLTRQAVEERFSHAVPVPASHLGANRTAHASSQGSTLQPNGAVAGAGEAVTAAGGVGWVGGCLPSQCNWLCTWHHDHVSSMQAGTANGKGTGTVWALVCPLCCCSAAPNYSLAGTGGHYMWRATMHHVLQEVLLARLERYSPGNGSQEALEHAAAEACSTGGTGKEGGTGKNGRRAKASGAIGSNDGAQQSRHAEHLQRLQRRLEAALCTLSADRHALQEASSLEGEHGGAVRAALALRVCEQELLLSPLMA